MSDIGKCRYCVGVRRDRARFCLMVNTYGSLRSARRQLTPSPPSFRHSSMLSRVMGIKEKVKRSYQLAFDGFAANVIDPGIIDSFSPLSRS